MVPDSDKKADLAAGRRNERIDSAARAAFKADDPEGLKPFAFDGCRLPLPLRGASTCSITVTITVSSSICHLLPTKYCYCRTAVSLPMLLIADALNRSLEYCTPSNQSGDYHGANGCADSPSRSRSVAILQAHATPSAPQGACQRQPTTTKRWRSSKPTVQRTPGAPTVCPHSRGEQAAILWWHLHTASRPLLIAVTRCWAPAQAASPRRAVKPARCASMTAGQRQRLEEQTGRLRTVSTTGDASLSSRTANRRQKCWLLRHQEHRKQLLGVCAQTRQA